MKSAKNYSLIELAAVGFMVFSSAQPVRAGNTTAVSSTGNGWVYSDLVYGSKVSLQNGSTASAVIKPASAVNYLGTNTFAPTGNTAIASRSPSGANPAFLSQATTVYAFGWKGQAKTSVAYPATAANDTLQTELTNRGFVLPGAKCGAQYEITSGGELDSFGKKWLVVYGNATDGTAAWFQGFAGGKKLYDVLITGPFDFGTNCPLRIPFDYNGNIDDVIFLADTVALTDTDLAFINLSPITVECPGTVQAPAGIGTTNGCGQTTLSYSPALGTSLPLGKTTVTVTAVDGALNEIVGTYDITVVDTTQPPSPTLPIVIGECSATFTNPTVTDGCAGTIITGATTNLLTYTSQGTNTVYWTFTDGRGNSNSATQTVIVKDTTPPVFSPSSLPIVTGDCSGGPITNLPTPTVTDNCPGTIQVLASPVGPYSTSTNVTWTATDAAGNQKTATQQVVINGVINGYQFRGFESPVNGKGGACNAPVSSSTATAGSNIPLKFDILDCRGAIATGVVPHIDIYKLNADCTVKESSAGDATFTNGQWHFAWKTKNPDKGWTFKIAVSLKNAAGVLIPGTENLGGVFLTLK